MGLSSDIRHLGGSPWRRISSPLHFTGDDTGPSRGRRREKQGAALGLEPPGEARREIGDGSREDSQREGLDANRFFLCNWWHGG
jgi:hypothetical protein